jgi:DNA mismatch endonuclease, patch repair protein
VPAKLIGVEWGRMDNLTSAARSETMRRVRSTDTGPEMAVRRLVHGEGYRYGLHCKDLPGCPDLVFRSRNAVLFVHGCFWHSHSCPRATLPRANRPYWRAKLESNRIRDRKNLKALRSSGWRTLVVWECQIERPDKVRERICRFLSGRR